jgi:hypothetical protein
VDRKEVVVILRAARRDERVQHLHGQERHILLGLAFFAI